MRIIATGHSLPQHAYTQQELTQALLEKWKDRYYNLERLNQFHQHMEVQSRRFCVPIERLAELEGWQDRNQLYVEHAVRLGTEAIQVALDKAGVDRERVDHLFFTSITGIAVPSVDALIVNRMGLRGDIRRSPFFGFGCLGGAAALSRAMDYVKAWPDKVAVVLSVELCSLTIQVKDATIANLVGTGLFGDGAAAVVVAGEDTGLQGVQVLQTHASFYPDTERVMGWDVVDTGLKLVLSPTVPNMVRQHAREDFERLMQLAGRKAEEVKHHLCHPGGPKVLQAMQETLKLDESALHLSWETLRTVGNLSSTSVLLILEETCRQRNPQAGELGVLMAMGPGFCSEWLLLQW